MAHTHEVLDLHYHEDEGQGCFSGTYLECLHFIADQTPHFMYKIAPIIAPTKDFATWLEEDGLPATKSILEELRAINAKRDEENNLIK